MLGVVGFRGLGFRALGSCASLVCRFRCQRIQRGGGGLSGAFIALAAAYAVGKTAACAQA